MSEASTVTLYTTAWCPFCLRAKALLQQKSIKFNEIPVDGDTQKRQEMMRLSGRHTVPQIWIGNTHVGGCDELMSLERSGKLDQLLSELDTQS
ncbi:MAG: glutaredoxin 3 [Saccharospirillum sp.]|nr:glutaredoxin 3 [Saccharospirillum sp.]